MQDFRVNMKRQEIVLIVAHRPTGAAQLLGKPGPSSSRAALSRAGCGEAGGGPP